MSFQRLQKGSVNLTCAQGAGAGAGAGSKTFKYLCSQGVLLVVKRRELLKHLRVVDQEDPGPSNFCSGAASLHSGKPTVTVNVPDNCCA